MSKAKDKSDIPTAEEEIGQTKQSTTEPTTGEPKGRKPEPLVWIPSSVLHGLKRFTSSADASKYLMTQAEAAAMPGAQAVTGEGEAADFALTEGHAMALVRIVAAEVVPETTTRVQTRLRGF